MIIIPENEGKDHINIYSKSKTDLGRMLSNWYRYPIYTEDGKFMSVEGYWFWLGLEPCEERERLRDYYGYKAKQVGTMLQDRLPTQYIDNFEEKILKAIELKFKQYRYLIIKEYEDLPILHYYNYNGKIVDMTAKYQWLMDGITKLRDKLVYEDHLKKDYLEGYNSFKNRNENISVSLDEVKDENNNIFYGVTFNSEIYKNSSKIITTLRLGDMEPKLIPEYLINEWRKEGIDI